MIIHPPEDLPIPDISSRVADALDQLGVGQCLFIETDKVDYVRSYTNKWGVKVKKSFATRTRIEDGKRGIRIWRLK
jgi:hypothetical protein